MSSKRFNFIRKIPISSSGSVAAFLYVTKVIFASSLFYYLISSLLNYSQSHQINFTIPSWYTSDGTILLVTSSCAGILCCQWLVSLYSKYLRTLIISPGNFVSSLILGAIFVSLYFYYIVKRELNSQITPYLDNFMPYIVSAYLGFVIMLVIRSVAKVATYLRDSIKTTKQEVLLNIEEDIADDPITLESEDILDRKIFIDDLHKQIIGLKFKSSFVFGLQGEWGEGKTSVLNLLCKRLEKTHSVFKFDPWFFNDEKPLVESFLRDLGIVIGDKYIFPSLKKTFAKYGKLILNPLEKYTSIDFSVLTSFMGDETLEDIKNRIVKTLEPLDRKIIIFVDNLDRLQQPEVLQVFKLVKLVSNFPNTVFILSLDQGVVNSVLTKEGDRYFIEKIIQKIVQLPKPRQKAIDEYLGSYLDKIVLESGLSKREQEEIGKQFLEIYQERLKHSFTTLRRVKRYLNSLRATLASEIQKEVSLYDILLLEAIKVFFSSVYEDLWKNRWYYISNDWDIQTSMESPFPLVPKNDQVNKTIREHIDTVLGSYSQSEKNIIFRILCNLFLSVDKAFNKQNHDFRGMSSEYRTKQRVSHPDVFRKYFALAASPDELFDSEVKALIAQLNSSEEKQIIPILSRVIDKHRKNKRFNDFIEKLDIFHKDFLSKTATEVVRGLYTYENKLEKVAKKFWGDSELDKLFVIAYRLLNEVMEKEQIEPSLEDIANNASIFFAVRAVDYATSNQAAFHQVKSATDSVKLIGIIDARLTSLYIEAGINIFQSDEQVSGYVLRTWALYNPDTKLKVNKYIVSILQKDLIFIGKILGGFAIEWADERSQIEYDDAINIYNEDKLYEFAKKLDPSELKTKKEKTGVELFIRVYEDRKAKVSKED